MAPNLLKLRSRIARARIVRNRESTRMKISHTVPLLAAVLAFGASAAFATPTPAPTLTGSYSITGTESGGPSITYSLPHNPFSVSLPLTPGTETTPRNFFTASPHSTCSGSCVKTYNKYGKVISEVETDVLTIDFANLKITGLESEPIDFPTLTETATFTASYLGPELGCAIGDGSAYSNSHESDCVVWDGAANTYNGSTSVTDLGDGYDLDIYLYNQTDWNITPTLGFEVVPVPPSVPEPASLALFAAGLAALGWSLSRRKKAG
ncbi:MAG: PEP-CTERM sorting domain-containing protein [Steroidobacteraceae bacterium]